MGGREMEIKQLGNVDISAEQALGAVRHIACRVAADNPHSLDDDMPRWPAGSSAGTRWSRPGCSNSSTFSASPPPGEP